MLFFLWPSLGHLYTGRIGSHDLCVALQNGVDNVERWPCMNKVIFIEVYGSSETAIKEERNPSLDRWKSWNQHLLYIKACTLDTP